MNKAVTAITLNPCTDRTLQIDTLTPGGHHVVRSVIDNVAGKGIDVNVVLRHLNVPTLAVGFSFEGSAGVLEQFMREEDIPFLFQSAPGSQRINTKVFETANMQMTEFNCKGPLLNDKNEQELMLLMDKALDETAILVACGSVPPGISPDIYRKMIESAHARGIPAVLDATGPLFDEGIKACPEVIKPNIGELELFLGKKLDSREEIIEACRQIIRQGVGAVCLTLGKDGALMVTASQCFFSPGLKIDVRGVQGAGDSVVAGICAAMLRTDDPAEWLRSGVAAAHGSLIREGTLLCELAPYTDFLARIPVTAI